MAPRQLPAFAINATPSCILESMGVAVCDMQQLFETTAVVIWRKHTAKAGLRLPILGMAEGVVEYSMSAESPSGISRSRTTFR